MQQPPFVSSFKVIKEEEQRDFTTIPRVRDGPRLWSLARTPASDPGWGGGLKVGAWWLGDGWARARTFAESVLVVVWSGPWLFRRENCGGQ